MIPYCYYNPKSTNGKLPVTFSLPSDICALRVP